MTGWMWLVLGGLLLLILVRVIELQNVVRNMEQEVAELVSAAEMKTYVKAHLAVQKPGGWAHLSQCEEKNRPVG